MGVPFDPTVCGAFSSLALENLEKLQKSCLSFWWESISVHSRRPPRGTSQWGVTETLPVSAYPPVLQGKNFEFLIKPIPPPCLINHLFLVFSDKPPNRESGILAKAPTKGTWNLNLVFGFRLQDGWPPVLAFPAKRQHLLLGLDHYWSLVIQVWKTSVSSPEVTLKSGTSHPVVWQLIRS